MVEFSLIHLIWSLRLNKIAVSYLICPVFERDIVIWGAHRRLIRIHFHEREQKLVRNRNAFIFTYYIWGRTDLVIASVHGINAGRWPCGAILGGGVKQYLLWNFIYLSELYILDLTLEHLLDEVIVGPFFEAKWEHLLCNVFHRLSSSLT